MRAIFTLVVAVFLVVLFVAGAQAYETMVFQGKIVRYTLQSPKYGNGWVQFAQSFGIKKWRQMRDLNLDLVDPTNPNLIYENQKYRVPFAEDLEVVKTRAVQQTSVASLARQSQQSVQELKVLEAPKQDNLTVSRTVAFFRQPLVGAVSAFVIFGIFPLVLIKLGVVDEEWLELVIYETIKAIKLLLVSVVTLQWLLWIDRWFIRTLAKKNSVIQAVTKIQSKTQPEAQPEKKGVVTTEATLTVDLEGNYSLMISGGQQPGTIEKLAAILAECGGKIDVTLHENVPNSIRSLFSRELGAAISGKL